MKAYQDYIGVFDSGLGGISVLRAILDVLPNENYIFYGDSAHAPYGDKTKQEICEISCDIAERMIAEGAKAVVIACNTATSAAAATLRENYPETAIVGLEPALKPAVEAGTDKQTILVMATQATLSLEKYRVLYERFADEANIIPMPCPGLVDLIEEGDLGSPAIHDYLQDRIGHLAGKVESVVLGCTHYPFIKRQIRDVLGDVKFFDGGVGAAQQLKRLLEGTNLLSVSPYPGTVKLSSSIESDEELKLYRWFLEEAPL